jgi:hypothetical protein
MFKNKEKIVKHFESYVISYDMRFDKRLEKIKIIKKEKFFAAIKVYLNNR